MKQTLTVLIIQLKINTSYETEPYSAIIQLKIHTSYETETYSADHSVKDSHIIWNRALQCWSFN